MAECTCIPQTTESPISLGLSILAIVISIVAIYLEYRGRRTELEMEFFTAHFKDALNKAIPEARNKLSFEGEKLQNIDSLIEVLAEMRRTADYFKYAEPGFYEQFKAKNQEIEDFLADGKNKNYDQQRQRCFYDECDKKLRELYKVITKKYFGS